LTILNESGIPDVLPPLHAANSLAERLPSALVVVLGTRSEAFMVQSLSAPPSPGYSPPPRSPRVVFMVLGESDPPEQGYIASRIVEAAAGFRRLEAVFVVSGLSTAKLGVEAEFEARLAERRLEIPVEALDPDAPRESPGVLATDLEDRATAALLAMCPEQSSSELVEKPGPEKGGRSLLGGFLGRGRDEYDEDEDLSPVVLAGAFGSAKSGRELASEMRRAGLTVAGTVPAMRMRDLPDMGENTVVALMDANLAETVKAAEERGARVARTLMPIGVDGTARFIQEVAEAAGGSANELSKARSVWEGFQILRNRVRGKRLFFAGDTGMELPLARFLADAGAVVLEVGVPRLDRSLLAEEIQALGPDVDIVESPDWRGQMTRIEDTRPDCVISSAGLFAPLVARGHLCRLASDFARIGPHGYDGARRILESFDRAFERAERLDHSIGI
jgi:light-independent protochlorophyllide reductase subunit N